MTPESSDEEFVEFFFKWMDQRKILKTWHWIAFYMDFICGIFTILMCYDFNIPSYGRTAVSSIMLKTIDFSLEPLW